MTSIRLFIRWSGDNRERCAEHTVELPCHVGVEAKTGDDGALILQLTIGAGSESVCPQCDHMQGAEIAARYQAIYDQFAAFSQVNEYDFSSFIGHGNQIPRFELDTSQYQQVPQPLRKGAT